MVHHFAENTVKVNNGNINTIQQGIILYDHRTLYLMQTEKIIQNTLVKTSFFDDTSCIGTRTIPANFLRVGSAIRMNIRCDFSCSGNPTNIIDIEMNGTSIISSSAQLGKDHTNDYTEINSDIMIRTIGETGSVIMMGRTIISGGNSDISRKLMITTPVTINTTIANEIKVFYTWGTESASNILKIESAIIQILN